MVKKDMHLYKLLQIKNLIMGPFSYIPFMECNHAILSMKNQINGIINFNDKKLEFKNGIGYIEKDWGCSFPKNYKINIYSNFQIGKKLIAPTKEKMSKEIYENIDSNVNVVLEKDNKIIFKDISHNCGLEIVN